MIVASAELDGLAGLQCAAVSASHSNDAKTMDTSAVRMRDRKFLEDMVAIAAIHNTPLDGTEQNQAVCRRADGRAPKLRCRE